MAIKIIITGATGFVGEGVLRECLKHPHVSAVLMLNRRPLKLEHPKLQELIVPDFFQIATFAEALKGYDACFFCAGISSVGLNEAAYTRITYDTTLHVADALLAQNPDMVFNFISGGHTDSTEKGKVMWARVKGKTENALMKLPFKNEYNFRPGGMLPAEGQQNVKPVYKFLVKAIAFFAPKLVLNLQELAWAMVYATICGSTKQVLEIADIKALAKPID